MGKSSSSDKARKNRSKKKEREFILTTSLFLLSKEELRKQFWNVKSVKYDKQIQKVSVGINTTNGKHGTTLAKLRKVAKDLSNHLYDQGLTFRQAKIGFFIDKEEEQIERIYQLLDKVSL
ncbi:MAG: hypothetical protein AAGF07_02280 [Patescibacteria group bacterium]